MLVITQSDSLVSFHSFIYWAKTVQHEIRLVKLNCGSAFIVSTNVLDLISRFLEFYYIASGSFLVVQLFSG